MTINVTNDGKEKYQSVEATWDGSVSGGMGYRNADLTGWGANENEARKNLLEQAKALRDDLNKTIEQMISELIPLQA